LRVSIRGRALKLMIVIQLMLHLLAANYDWHHHITPTSEEIRVFATIFPMVCCLFTPTKQNFLADKPIRTIYSSASPDVTSTPHDYSREKLKDKRSFSALVVFFQVVERFSIIAYHTIPLIIQRHYEIPDRWILGWCCNFNLVFLIAKTFPFRCWRYFFARKKKKKKKNIQRFISTCFKCPTRSTIIC
jgi:hypothetical protein